MATGGGGQGKSSSYRGVDWHSQAGKWRVQIKVHGTKYNLGYYEDEDDAARKYNTAANFLLRHWYEHAQQPSSIPATAQHPLTPRSPPGTSTKYTGSRSLVIPLMQWSNRNCQCLQRPVVGCIVLCVHTASLMYIAPTPSPAKALLNPPNPPSGPRSKYKGVCWHKQSGKWQVTYKGITVGRYEDEHDAARAFNNVVTYVHDTGYVTMRHAHIPVATCAHMLFITLTALCSTMLKGDGHMKSPPGSTPSCKSCVVCRGPH